MCIAAPGRGCENIASLRSRAASAVVMGTLALSAQLPGQNVSRDQFLQPRDARRLRTGTFFSSDLDHGKEVGYGKISIQEIPGTDRFRLSSVATFASGFSGFHSQRWEAVALRTFAPLSAQLAFVGNHGIVPAFDLHYAAGRAHGFVVHHVNAIDQWRTDVDAPVPPDIVDQRIDWAALLPADLAPGRSYHFTVFDPGTGFSKITEQVLAETQAQVPAGTFAAYKIVDRMEKTSGTETFQLLAKRDLPRMMLREEFPNGTVSELVRIADR